MAVVATGAPAACGKRPDEGELRVYSETMFQAVASTRPRGCSIFAMVWDNRSTALVISLRRFFSRSRFFSIFPSSLLSEDSAPVCLPLAEVARGGMRLSSASWWALAAAVDESIFPPIDAPESSSERSRADIFISDDSPFARFLDSPAFSMSTMMVLVCE